MGEFLKGRAVRVGNVEEAVGKVRRMLGVVAHRANPSTQEAEAGRRCEFKASLGILGMPGLFRKAQSQRTEGGDRDGK